MNSFSCSLDYSDAGLADTLSEEVPDIIIENYESVEVRNGSPALKIEAEEALFFNTKEETHLSGVDFYNYEDRKVSTHGKTSTAILDMKSGDASMSGGILIESEEDSSRLEAQSLNWIDDDRLLSSGRGEVVSVRDQDGSRLEGSGFSADIKRKEIIFEGEVSGEFISE
ncbi:MAG: LPS export ABC transporter periplasmic protein LptC [Spirochaetales bacterium]|nr:LPS export ABC transporter periplasmic protein LptC [Spirochaetales bacterium]